MSVKKGDPSRNPNGRTADIHGLVRTLTKARGQIESIQRACNPNAEYQRYAELNDAHAAIGDCLASLLRAESFSAENKT